MLDIGFQELLIIMVVALLVFGPDKLPDLGRRLGRALREFRRASDEFRTTVETNLRLHEDILPPSLLDPGVTAAPAGPAVSLEESPAVAGADAPPAGNHAVVAGSPPDVSAVPVEALEPFWMRRGGRLLHRSACAWRQRAAETDRVAIKTAGEGWELGLQPCPICDPRESEVTS
jgi:TatA/E family protein of Tat protein translocase